MTKCKLYLDHTPVWSGDGFFCSNCMTEFCPTNSLPMGASQWKEHGKKFTYWDYFIGPYDEYIALLEKECGSLGGLAFVHGWRAKEEDVKKGEELREKIKKSKE